MKTLELNGSKRENTGKKDAAKLRKEGFVPAVVYGGDNELHIQIDERDLDKIIYTADTYNVLLKVDGETYSTVLQDAQFDALTDKATHVDFLLVNNEKPVTVSMSINLEGSAIGVRNGGKLRKPMRKLKLKGTLSAIPDSVDIDITDLKIGSAVKVADLNFDGIELLDPASNVVVAVKTARGAVADEEEEGEEEAAEA
jgi:large subunit ribosomal protein L25